MHCIPFNNLIFKNQIDLATAALTLGGRICTIKLRGSKFDLHSRMVNAFQFSCYTYIFYTRI